jgi:hypothetical protein
VPDHEGVELLREVLPRPEGRVDAGPLDVLLAVQRDADVLDLRDTLAVEEVLDRRLVAVAAEGDRDVVGDTPG